MACPVETRVRRILALARAHRTGARRMDARRIGKRIIEGRKLAMFCAFDAIGKVGAGFRP